MQQGNSHQVSQSQRYQTGQQSEDEKTLFVAFDTFHVHLQTGQEHDVIESYASKKVERAVALQNVQSVLAYEDASKYQTDDMRNT